MIFIRIFIEDNSAIKNRIKSGDLLCGISMSVPLNHQLSGNREYI